MIETTFAKNDVTLGALEHLTWADAAAGMAEHSPLLIADLVLVDAYPLLLNFVDLLLDYVFIQLESKIFWILFVISSYDVILETFKL